MKMYNKLKVILLSCCFTYVFMPFTSYAQDTDKATFAGGCFWCLESDFDKVPGVIKTTSGYTGGSLHNPSYKQVSAGGTGHFESVQIIFDPKVVSYNELLDIFWHSIDPTDADGQFCDRGAQYRSAIFYHDAEQKSLAMKSKEKLVKSAQLDKVATEILPLHTFYPAEEYHQNYHAKNPIRYNYYRYTCGRDQRLEKVWGKK